MRNWNINWAVPRRAFSEGFYSTYEELKQKVWQGRSRIFPRFYSTYEELKHIISNL